MTYDLTLKGFVGGWDFDSDYIDYVLNKKKDSPVYVLIDSLGGYTHTGLSVSSAFRNHGDVSVTFRGMNASAATIAALGAKHVAMEEDALYLIHKCSVTVFEWASMNEEQLKEHIEKLEHTRQNSMKVDIAVARAYAKRTGKTTDELLSLMSKELWLTADEAKEYGFIDKVIKTEEKKSEVVLTSSMEDKFKEAGIPIPSMLKHEEESLFAKLSKLFKSKNMEQNNNQQQQQQSQEQQQSQQQQQQSQQQQSEQQPTLESLQKSVSDLQTQLKSLSDANKALTDENTKLKSDIEELKKKPVDETTSVINNGGSNGEEEKNDFLSSLQEANELSKLLG
jgi:ATP-dependent protease ClpP protease subunit/regulator of replication initiation timing